MRYFKYKNTNKNINNALIEQYKTLTEDEKRAFRRQKRWRKFSTVVSLIIYVSFIVAGIFLLKLIPLPSTWYLEVLVIVGKVIVGFILVIVGSVLTVGLTMPLWKMVESFHIPSMKKEIFSNHRCSICKISHNAVLDRTYCKYIVGSSSNHFVSIITNCKNPTS